MSRNRVHVQMKITYNLGTEAWMNCFREIFAGSTGLRVSIPIIGPVNERGCHVFSGCRL